MKKPCLELYCELAYKSVDLLSNVPTLCVDDHQLTKSDVEVVGASADVCAHIVLKCLHFAQIGGDEIWTVNAVARAVTMWNRACDQNVGQTDEFSQNHFGSSTILSFRKQSPRMQGRLIPSRFFFGGIYDRFQVNIRWIALKIW